MRAVEFHEVRTAGREWFHGDRNCYQRREYPSTHNRRCPKQADDDRFNNLKYSKWDCSKCSICLLSLKTNEGLIRDSPVNVMSSKCGRQIE